MDKHVKQANCPKGGPHRWVSTTDAGTMSCDKCGKKKQVSTKGKRKPVVDPA